MIDNTINKLRIIPVTSDYPNTERLLNIRDEAFPPNERPDSRDVSKYNDANGYAFMAFEDDHVPVGFALLRNCGDNMCFGIYFAIGKEFRNRHYGSRLLKLLLEGYLKRKIFFGCVEALLPETENYQQRLDRVRFYQRNGMFVLDEVMDAGAMGKYQFVCTDPNITCDRLKVKMTLALPSLMDYCDLQAD